MSSIIKVNLLSNYISIQRLPQSNCVWVDNDVRPLPSVCVSVLCDGRVVKVGGADAQSLAMTANTLRVSDLSCQYLASLPVVMRWGSFPLESLEVLQ